ncbi:dihydrolipoamide acetyltransferase family protein [Nocardia sp. NPDC006630]|uniref:dihydrolipoamide acetyltransferase family protein n=1 Tax=Nocardia sp. NPDC006630 TaxID=3157181 RepID=UPI0033B5F6C4
MPEITMPRLSDTMEEGVVVTWLKQVGDKVARGEILAEIETDKALMDLEAYDNGVLEQILADAGTRVAVGTPIAVVGDGTGTKPTVPPAQTSDASTPTVSNAPAPALATVGPRAGSDKAKASPLARKVARELNVDIAVITGTGPGGRITRQDVESASARKESTVATHRPPSPILITTDTDRVALSGVQKVAARRLTESKQQSPHFYLTNAIDVTDLLTFRAQVNRSRESTGAAKVSVNDLIIKAVAATLRRDGRLNVSFAGDTLLQHRGIHLGMAVSIDAGLVVPTIRDADRKTISEIAAESKDKAERARAGRLRAEEMSGSTFTISNLGMFGVEQFAAIINPPEAAILAVGAAIDTVQLVEDRVVIRKILRVTLSADHRAVDGATAAAFLQLFRNLLENPILIVT